MKSLTFFACVAVLLNSVSAVLAKPVICSWISTPFKNSADKKAKFLIDDEWSYNRDWDDPVTISYFMQRLQDAGIDAVIHDSTNWGQWDELDTAAFGQCATEIPLVEAECAARGMKQTIGFSAGEPYTVDIALANERAKRIWNTYAQKDTWLYFEGKPVCVIYLPMDADMFWDAYNAAAENEKDYLELFYIGKCYGDGWGWALDESARDNAIRYIRPGHNKEDCFGDQWYDCRVRRTEAEWEQALQWGLQAEHFLILSAYDDIIDGSFWGIADSPSDLKICNQPVGVNNPWKYYNLVRQYCGQNNDNDAPESPTGLLATGSHGFIALDWNDNAASDVICYNIYRSTTADSANCPYALVSRYVRGSHYDDTAVTNGQTYYYTVTAIDRSGHESAFSSQVSLSSSGSSDVPAATYQAEQFSSQIGCQIASSHAGYTGTGFVEISDSNWFEWDDIAGGDGGYCTLLFRYASINDRNCKLFVNGTHIETITFPATSDWATWSTTQIDTVLKSGLNTIRLQGSSSAPNIDKLDVIVELDNSAPTPNPANWATAPAGFCQTKITMTAVTGNDTSDVEYYFDCLTDGGHDSGWQVCPTYTDVNLTADSTYQYRVQMRDRNGNYSAYSDTQSGTTLIQYPYGGTARYLPGRIEVEDYDEGGEALAYHDDDIKHGTASFRPDDTVDVETTQDMDGNYNIGWTDDDEYLEYTVNIDAKLYDICARVASPYSGRELYVKLNDDLLCRLDIPDTGGHQNWQTVTFTNVSVPEVNNGILRLVIEEGGYNINWVEFVPSSDITAPGTPVGLNAFPGQESVSLIWDNNAESDLAYYKIYRSTTSQGPYTYLNKTTAGINTFMDSGLHTINGTTFYYVVKAVDTSGNQSLYSQAVPATPASDPGLFDTNQDIGSPCLAGMFSHFQKNYTVSGSGSDIWHTNDNFHYVYKTLDGDGAIIVRVDSVDNTNTWAKAGVMIRNSINPDAKNVAIVMTPGQGVSFQSRSQTGNVTQNQPVVGPACPYWIRLIRSGETFTGEYSVDGLSWTSFNHAFNVDIASTATIGLCVTSHDDTLMCSASFSNVSIIEDIYQGDLNLDGTVDMKDMAELGLYWFNPYDMNTLEAIADEWLKAQPD